jgi:hypothetical protein
VEVLPMLSSKRQEQLGTISNLLALSQQHLDRFGPYLQRMETEDIATLAVETYGVVEEA